MKKYLEILKKCPLFEGIDENDLLKMLNCLDARVEFFNKKHTVLSEGAVAKYIGVVLSGEIQISNIDYSGNRSLRGRMSESEIFAEEFACAGLQSTPVAFIAAEDSEIMLINCSHIVHTCAQNCSFHQKLIYNLMNALAKKTITFHHKIEITSKRTTREKLMAYLFMISSENHNDEFEIPFDRQELADYLEVDRSGLSTEISKLKAEGVIESERKHFKLL